MDTPILEFVLTELNARKGRWPDICKALPSIQYSWLTKLAQGKIPAPGVQKIQILADYFRGIKHEETGKAA